MYFKLTVSYLAATATAVAAQANFNGGGAGANGGGLGSGPAGMSPNQLGGQGRGPPKEVNHTITWEVWDFELTHNSRFSRCNPKSCLTSNQSPRNLILYQPKL